MNFRNILLIGVTGLLFACSSDVTEAQHIANAEKYLDEGQFKAASIELKNALQKNANNPKARMLLGKVNLDTGNIAGAEKELKKAAELGFNDESVTPLLASALLNQGKYDELTLLSSDSLSNQGKAKVLSAQGLAKLSQGKQDDAQILIKKAVSVDDNSTEALLAMARLHLADKNIDLARKELEAVFEIDPDYAAAWSLLGNIEKIEQNLDLAEIAYSKAIKNRINNSGDYLQRAFVRIQLQKINEAQKDVDKLIAYAPKNAGVNFAQGLIHYQSKDYQNAIPSLEIALAEESRYPNALLYLGTANFLQKNIATAETHTRRYLSLDPDNIDGRKLLATILLNKQEYDKAEEIIKPVAEKNQTDVASLNLLADILLKQGKTGEANIILAKVAALQPDSPGAQARLGEGLLAEGLKDKGIEQVESALRLNPEYQQAEIILILNSIKEKNFGEAIKAAEEYQEKYPEIVTPNNILGRTYLAAGEEDKAREAFSKARSIAPGNPYACLNLGTLSIKNKDYDSARAYLQEILDHNDNYLPALMQLASLEALRNNEPAMVAYLEQAIDSHPNAVEPRLVMSRYYLSKNNPERASNVLFELEPSQKKNPEVLNVLAVSQLMQKDYSAAIITLEQLIKLRPNSAPIYGLLAKAYAGFNDLDKTLIALEKTVELAPNNISARTTLTRLLLRMQKFDAAEKQVKILKQQAPQDPAVKELEASLARISGNQIEGLKLSEDAFKISPITSNMRALARQKWKMGDTEGAHDLLRSWVSEHPDDISARLALGGFYLGTNQAEKGLEQYNKVLELDGNNIIALNNLAWFIRDSDPKRALDYATHANKLEPESATLLDTLAVVLLKNGEIQKAQSTITRAIRKTPNNPTTLYHGAVIEIATGDKASAIKTLQSILIDGVDFPEKEQASNLLEKLTH